MSAEEKPVDDWRDDLAVFPLDGKHPMVRWRAESAPWEEWTGRWPKGAGFGIDCGKSGLVVIDEDEPGAVERWLGYRPLTHTVRTGKGRHFYFLADPDVPVRNRTRLASGVDVRGEGGYVVGSGSAHPDGGRYQAENSWRPARLPDGLRARLLARDSPPEAAEAVEPSERAERLVLPEVIEDGQRGDLLFRLACSLEARGMTDAEALPLLHEAWSRCEPPYDERTPEEMWAHVVAQYRSDRVEVEGLLVSRREFERQRDARLVWRLADRAALDRIEEAEVEQAPDKWLPGDVVLDIDPVSPIWGPAESPWTAAGQSTLLVGPDGTSKSTLCQHYSKARIGLPGWAGELLGDPVLLLPEDQMVLYLAADRPVQIMEGFKRGMTEEMREALRERLRFWPGPPPMDLVTRAGRRWLLQVIEEVNAGLLILDSRKDVGDVLDPKAVSGLNRLLKQLDAEGVEVLMPHHNIQSADPPSIKPDLTHTMGLREVYSGLGSVLMIKGKPGAEVLNLHQVKPIREKHPSVRVRVDFAAGRLHVAPPLASSAGKHEISLDLTGSEDATEPGEPTLDDQVLALLVEAGTTGMMTTEITGRGEEGRARRRSLDRLMLGGLVARHQHGRGHRWWVREFAPPDAVSE